ncbi:hypothetical protein GYB57_10865 [bacterium]|nr:hypothetical protein [bacterium]
MQVVIPIEFVVIDEGIHLLVKVEVNSFRVNLVLDTGASKSVLDSNSIDLFLVDQIHDTDEESTSIGNTTLRSQKALIEELKFGGITLWNKMVNVLDLSNVIHVYESLSLPLIHGILGADLLQEMNAVVDFKNKTLMLEY